MYKFLLIFMRLFEDRSVLCYGNGYLFFFIGLLWNIFWSCFGSNQPQKLKKNVYLSAFWYLTLLGVALTELGVQLNFLCARVTDFLVAFFFFQIFNFHGFSIFFLRILFDIFSFTLLLVAIADLAQWNFCVVFYRRYNLCVL